MKIGIFTDSHYATDAAHAAGYARLKGALDAFSEAGCTLAVFLGDLTDKEKTHAEEIASLQRLRALFEMYSFPVFVMFGNHDIVNFSKEEFYEILGEHHRPKNGLFEGRNLFFLDTCCFKDGRDYQRGNGNWQEIYVPRLDVLREELKTAADAPSYIFTHFPLDPAATPWRRVHNADAVMKILEESGKVRTVFQGHDHRRIESMIGDIRYATYEALLDTEDAFFIEEI
jgi:3',5'-cyclic AMP phosphodiesterase CpdA